MAQMVTLPDSQFVPALGLGTWRMGESSSARRREVAAVRLALELGCRLIDTAEMYGDGGAEEVVGAALAEAFAAGTLRREELFVVTKIYPHNASRTGTPAACERSLRRLGLDVIDLYLLHWKGSHALSQTVDAFEALRAAGRIRHWGVSNFDARDMDKLWRVLGGGECAANQVYYSAGERGAEFELLPWMRERGMPLMAYCPIDQGSLARDGAFRRVGARHGMSAAQAALAWLLREPGVIAIPKAVKPEHVRENFALPPVRFTAADLAEIDAAFPPPREPGPLAVV
jgi:diketogulonate reductase-like aldo/keto reductase